PSSAASALPVSVSSTAVAQARTASVVASSSGRPAGTRTTRTPSACSSAGVPGTSRVRTVTSCPALTNAAERPDTCRPRPPTTAGGYSHETISTRSGRLEGTGIVDLRRSVVNGRHHQPPPGHRKYAHNSTDSLSAAMKPLLFQGLNIRPYSGIRTIV